MNPADLRSARVLIVDDEEAHVRLLKRVLQRADYTNVIGTTDPTQIYTLMDQFQPDLVLVDLHMPQLDGFAVLEYLQRRIGTASYLPVLVLTADINLAAKQRALSLGAKDFLTKPFDVTEVLLRIANLLQTRAMHLLLQQQNDLLEEKIRSRTHNLEEAELEILRRLALAAEYRDDDTGEHTQRVGQMACRLAEALGLPAAEISLIVRAAPLHDVGKIGIPDGILLKRGPLTDVEMAHMRTHTTIGMRMLAGSQFPVLQLAAEIALTHHERWDGSGYPQGLAGEAIPITGRIVALADVFDALTHERPYKPAWSVADAVAEIVRQGGHQFDPRLVPIFVQALPSGLAHMSAGTH